MAISLFSNVTCCGSVIENTTLPKDLNIVTANGKDVSNVDRDSDSPISNEISRNIQWIFALVIVPCVSLPGILGNVSSLLVLYRHGFKKTSNILLGALTLADACYLIGVNNVATYIHDYSSSPGFAYSTRVCYFLYGLYRIYFLLELWGNWCSLTLPVLITFERLVAVYFPFEFPQIVTPRRTWIAVTSVFIFWVPINVYYFFLEDLVFINTNGQQLGVIIRTSLYTDKYYKHIYLTVNRAAIIITEPVSVVMVIVGCIMVGVKVRVASVKRQKLMSAVLSVTKQAASVPASRTTWTLMLVCIMYTITIGSAFFIQLTVTRDRDTKVDKLLDTLVRFVKCMHSSCNFFIYVYVNRNFRNTYSHIFGSWTNRRKKQDTVCYRTS